jgi:hypothetical protein
VYILSIIYTNLPKAIIIASIKTVKHGTIPELGVIKVAEYPLQNVRNEQGRPE